MAKRFEGIEDKHERERNSFFEMLKNMDRRTFMKVSAISAAIGYTKGLMLPQSFQLIEVAQAAPVKAGQLEGEKGAAPFTIAYISDAHLYEKGLNDRFVRSITRAVDDINNMRPQPDFVLFGGDLAQLGSPTELKLGLEILKSCKAPVRMMVGEHDWFLDLGETWQAMFGEPTYSFDHKGVHFVTLMSVNEKDFWTEHNYTPKQRMDIVAGLDDGRQSRFEVGDKQRDWLKKDLEKYSTDTPIVVFSHSPLYKYYRDWNFWTDDAEQVQAILNRFDNVTVIHGHTHQMLSNRLGNINFHGMLSTAWPWPYAPEGLPKLTIQMDRANPFNELDGLGDGRFMIHPESEKHGALAVDALYNLWNRRPVTITSAYLKSDGKKEKPLSPNLLSY